MLDELEGAGDLGHLGVWGIWGALGVLIGAGDWIASLAKDPKLAPHFEWNSQRLYKFDGEKFVRFFDEPWTGELLWAMEVCF